MKIKNFLNLVNQNLIYQLNFKIEIQFLDTASIQPELPVQIYLKFQSLGYGIKKPTIFLASATIGPAISFAFKAPS